MVEKLKYSVTSIIASAGVTFAVSAVHAGPMSYTDFEAPGFVAGGSVDNLLPDGTPGSNQEAWWIPTATTDEEIVDVGGSHNKVWRLSQGADNGWLGNAPHSASSGAVSGELAGADSDSGLGAPTTPNFYAQFEFRSATGGQQNGLFIDVSANSGDTRQAFIYILDSADGQGFDLRFFDTVNDGFNGTDFDLNLSYSDWHTVGIEIMFVDGLDTGTSPNHATGGACSPSTPCVGNDVVNLYVNGSLLHTGTTWESLIGSRSVDRLLFASLRHNPPTSTDVITSQLGGGLYFDNVLVTDVKPAEVPEPGALALFGLGLAGLAAVRRRKTA